MKNRSHATLGNAEHSYFRILVLVVSKQFLVRVCTGLEHLVSHGI